jgi:hypothetical protein
MFAECIVEEPNCVYSPRRGRITKPAVNNKQIHLKFTKFCEFYIYNDIFIMWILIYIFIYKIMITECYHSNTTGTASIWHHFSFYWCPSRVTDCSELFDELLAFYYCYRKVWRKWRIGGVCLLRLQGQLLRNTDTNDDSVGVFHRIQCKSEYEWC